MNFGEFMGSTADTLRALTLQEGWFPTLSYSVYIAVRTEPSHGTGEGKTWTTCPRWCFSWCFCGVPVVPRRKAGEGGRHCGGAFAEGEVYLWKATSVTRQAEDQEVISVYVSFFSRRIDR